EKVRSDFGDGLEGVVALAGEFLFDKHQVIAHEVKNLFYRQKRNRLPPGRYHFVWDSAAAVSPRGAIRKKRRKFSAVLEAASSALKSLTLATVLATSAT